MSVLTQTPSIDLAPNPGAVQLFYLSDGSPVFGCVGSPEGVVIANVRALAIVETGAIFVKTTDAPLNTGWIQVGNLAIGSVITGATEGSVLFAGPGGVLAQDNASLYWNDVNNRLGIGTSSPSERLHVLFNSDPLLLLERADGGPTKLAIRNGSGLGDLHLGLFGSAIFFNSDGTLPIRIGVNGVTRLEVNSDGNIGIATSTFGASSVNVLAQLVGTAPTTSPPNTCQYFVKDSAANDANIYIRNEAGIESRLSGCTKQTTADQGHSSGVFDAVTGLSFNLEASTRYGFEVVLYTTGTVGEGVRARMNGTVTATHIRYEGYEKNANVDGGQARATALAGVVAAVTAVTAATIYISGGIQVDAAGTFRVEFDTNVALGDDALVVLRQSWMRIWEN